MRFVRQRLETRGSRARPGPSLWAAAAFLSIAQGPKAPGAVPPRCVITNPTVRGVRDLDGDGRRDVVYASPSSGADKRGVVCAISSADWAVLWQAKGSQPAALFGTALIPIHDLNSDGVDDILTAAPGKQAGASQDASVSILSGSTGKTLVSYPLELHDDCTGGKQIGDIDGDGVGEVVLENHYGFIVMSPKSGEHLACFHGWMDSPYCSIDILSDRDGDRVADVVMGEPGNFSGRCHVVSTKTAKAINKIDAKQVDAKGYTFGAAVVAVPDQDGDGKQEFCATDPAILAGEVPCQVVLIGSRTGQPIWTATIARAKKERWGVGLAMLARPEPLHDVLVVPGVTPDGVGVIEMSIETGQVERKVMHPGIDGMVGSGVFNIGDITGDGIADLAVCASNRWEYEVQAPDTALIVSGADLSLIKSLGSSMLKEN